LTKQQPESKLDKMKNQITITKQAFGNTTAFLLEGSLTQIENFFNQMFNWGATSGKLHDMGNGKAFYFYAQPEAILHALMRVAIVSLSNSKHAKGMKGGVLRLAQEKANRKFESIKEGRFLHASASNDTYNLGTITAEKPSDYCGAISSGRD
jgi:hypothetical protein